MTHEYTLQCGSRVVEAHKEREQLACTSTESGVLVKVHAHACQTSLKSINNHTEIEKKDYDQSKKKKKKTLVICIFAVSLYNSLNRC